MQRYQYSDAFYPETGKHGRTYHAAPPPFKISNQPLSLLEPHLLQLQFLIHGDFKGSPKNEN